MTGPDLWAEWSAAQRAIESADRRALISLGIKAADTLLLIGKVRAERDGDLYAPDEDGPPAFVTPVFVDYADTPESSSPAQVVRFGDLVDLVAWDPRHPHSWALRSGAAEWLGAIEPQYLEPPPVPIHRGPLGWLQAGCRGLVLLSRESVSQYRLLINIRRIEAEDAAHAAELHRIISRPWPVPTITVAVEHRHAA
jgi:hypothetical protein